MTMDYPSRHLGRSPNLKRLKKLIEKRETATVDEDTEITELTYSLLPDLIEAAELLRSLSPRITALLDRIDPPDREEMRLALNRLAPSEVQRRMDLLKLVKAKKISMKEAAAQAGISACRLSQQRDKWVRLGQLKYDETPTDKRTRLRPPRKKDDWPPSMTAEEIEDSIDQQCGCQGQYSCDCISIFNAVCAQAWYDHNTKDKSR